MNTIASLPSTENRRAGASHERSSQDLASIKSWCVARADEWYAKGELWPAAEFLRHALGVDPNDAQVWIALGTVYYEQRSYAKAGQAFIRAGQLEPLNVQVFLQLGLTHQQLGQKQEAEAMFKHALKIQPEHTLALSLAAKFMMACNRPQDARSYIESALGQHPDDVELLSRLGVCCFQMKDFSASRACFNRVLQIDPRNSVAKDNLAIIAARSTVATA